MRYRIVVLGALVLATAIQAQQPDYAKLKKDTTKVVQTAIGDVSLPPKAATDSPTFRRIIQVYDPETQEGIAGVEVIDQITGNSMKTSSTGHVVLLPEFVRATGALLTFRKMGYDAVEFLADPKSDTMLLVPMSRAVPTLPGMKVVEKATRTNMEDRARAFGAKIIPPGVLRSPAYEFVNLRDALRFNQITGNFPEKNSDLRGPRKIMPGQRMGCDVRIALDGSSIAGKSVDLDDSAGLYDGVEFYRSVSMMPEEFKSLAGPCGTLLVWSRAR